VKLKVGFREAVLTLHSLNYDTLVWKGDPPMRSPRRPRFSYTTRRLLLVLSILFIVLATVLTLRQPVQQLVEFIPPEQVRMQALIPTPTRETTVLESRPAEIQQQVLQAEQFPFQLSPEDPIRNFTVRAVTTELSATIKFADSPEGDWLAIAQQGGSNVVYGAIGGKQFSTWNPGSVDDRRDQRRCFPRCGSRACRTPKYFRTSGTSPYPAINRTPAG
jgi:hypothetical protein